MKTKKKHPSITIDKKAFLSPVQDAVEMTRFKKDDHVECKYSCEECKTAHSVFVRRRKENETLESYTHEVMACCDISHSMLAPNCVWRGIDLIMPVSQLTDEEFADARNRFPETEEQNPHQCGDAVGHSAAHNERILDEAQQ